MLHKLSLRNAKRQMSEYLIYLITVTISCALMFGFNSMIFSEEVINMAGQSELLIIFIVFFTILIVGVMGWLISYMLQYMLKKRSKEFGMYLLLGIEKKQVAYLFFRENILVGAVAFGGGVFLGGIVFQIIKTFIFYLYRESYQIALEYSPLAIGMTGICFILIYMRSLRKSKKVIRNMQVRELLYYDKKNEEIKTGNGIVKNIVFMIAVLCGGGGSIILIYLPQVPGKAKFYAGLCAVCLFLVFFYGFYLGIASLILRIADGETYMKFRKNRLFLIRSFTAKIDSMHATMFMVTLLLCLAVMTAGLGSSIGLTVDDSTDRMAYDVAVNKVGDTRDFGIYEEVLAEEVEINAEYIYPVYKSEYTLFLEKEKNYWISVGRNMEDMYQSDVMISFSDYQNLRSMLGYQEVPALSQEYYIHCVAGLESEFREKAEAEQQYQIGSTKLSFAGIYTELFAQYSYDVNGPRVILVVPDEVTEMLTPVRTIYATLTAEPISLGVYEQLLEVERKENKKIADYEDRSLVKCKASTITQQAEIYSAIVLPLYYLAFILAIAAITIIATLFLSDIEKNKRYYRVLKQVGMEKRKIDQMIFRQITSYFIFPCVFPIVIGSSLSIVFGKAMANAALLHIDKIYPVIGGIIVLYLVLYFIYYLASLLTFRRQILEND